MAHSITALIVSTIILASIPGPNAALIVATSLRYGFRSGLISIVGTTSGILFQISLVIFGFGILLHGLVGFLHAVKIVGSLYLIYLGLRCINSSQDKEINVDSNLSLSRNFKTGFVVSVTNPKTFIFNAAFLPQFIENDANAGLWDWLLVGTIFISILVFSDCMWALFASYLRGFIVRYGRFQTVFAGIFYILAGCLLGLVDIE